MRVMCVQISRPKIHASFTNDARAWNARHICPIFSARHLQMIRVIQPGPFHSVSNKRLSHCV